MILGKLPRLEHRETLGTLHPRLRELDLCAEFAAENFAGSGLGDGVYETNIARLLVVGEAFGNEST